MTDSGQLPKRGHSAVAWIDDATHDRIEALVRHTERSRSKVLRAIIDAGLPAVEAKYATHSDPKAALSQTLPSVTDQTVLADLHAMIDQRWDAIQAGLRAISPSPDFALNEPATPYHATPLPTPASANSAPPPPDPIAAIAAQAHAQVASLAQSPATPAPSAGKAPRARRTPPPAGAVAPR